MERQLIKTILWRVTKNNSLDFLCQFDALFQPDEGALHLVINEERLNDLTNIFIAATTEETPKPKRTRTKKAQVTL